MEHGPIAVRHVSDLASSDKRTLEQLLGQPLTEDAQVFVTVVPLSVIHNVAKRERGKRSANHAPTSTNDLDGRVRHA